MFVPYYLHKFKYKKQKTPSQFLLLTVNVFRGFFLLLIQQSLFSSLVQGLNSFIQGSQQQVPLLFEKEKSQPKWLIVVARNHSFSLVVSLVVPCCTNLYCLWSLVVPLAITRCHSLSFDVSFVYLFINIYTHQLVYHKNFYHLDLCLNLLLY